MRRLRKALKYLGIGLTAIVILIVGWLMYDRRSPMPTTQIFKGVTYTCERMPVTPESSGLMHLVKVDLTTPGLEFYATPVNPEAVAKGWQYYLRWVPSAAKENNLSVAVNGPIYTGKTWPRRLPGDLAVSVKTIIANHEVNHIDPHSYLMWFEDDLTPHMEFEKPPPKNALAKAKWGIGGLQHYIWNGTLTIWAEHVPDRWIMVGYDQHKILYIAGFEHVSKAYAVKKFAECGVLFAIMMDGGSSAAMWIGDDAKNIRSGSLMYPRAGAATIFGIRAPALQK